MSRLCDLDYELGPILGVGTFGQVHVARRINHSYSQSNSQHSRHYSSHYSGHPDNQTNDQYVALKIIAASRLSAAGRQSLINEIKIQRLANQPNNLTFNQTVRLIDSIDCVEIDGEWCSECGCNCLTDQSSVSHNHSNNQSKTQQWSDSSNAQSNKQSNNQSIKQSNKPPFYCSCGHSSTIHSDKQSRLCTILIQELCLGGDLQSIIQSTGRLNDQSCNQIFNQLIDLIDRLHSINLIHRDLKPENLVFTASGLLKLCDFGMATLRPTPISHSTDQSINQSFNQRLSHSHDEVSEIDDDDMDYSSYLGAQSNKQSNNRISNHQHQTNNQSINQPIKCQDDGTCIHHTPCGSMTYSAPEVLPISLNQTNNQSINQINTSSINPYKGAPADLWSCGVILFVMLTGHVPFQRPIAAIVSQTISQPNNQTINQSIKPDRQYISLMLGEYPSSINQSARDLLINMFRVHPDDRFSIQQIRQHPWTRSYDQSINQSINPLINQAIHQSFNQSIVDRCRAAWLKQGKSEVVELMDRMQHHKLSNNQSNNHFDSRSSNKRSSDQSINQSVNQSMESINQSMPQMQLSPINSLYPHERHLSSGYDLSAFRSPNNRSNNQSINHSNSAYHAFFRSGRPPINQPLSITAQTSLKPTTWNSQTTNQPTNQSNNQTTNQSNNQSNNQSINPPECEEDDQSVDESNDQSIHDSGYEDDQSSEDDRSSNQSINQPDNQLSNLPVNRSNNRSNNRTNNRSNNRTINQPNNRTINQPNNQTINQPNSRTNLRSSHRTVDDLAVSFRPHLPRHRLITPPVDQSLTSSNNQPINQSNNQSIDRTISQSANRSLIPERKTAEQDERKNLDP